MEENEQKKHSKENSSHPKVENESIVNSYYTKKVTSKAHMQYSVCHLIQILNKYWIITSV